MKKFILATVALASSFAVAQAQQITPRVEAGLNVSNLFEKNGDYTYDTKALPGFRIGVAAEFALPVNLGLPSSYLYVTPGLNFNMQGNKYTEADYDQTKVTTRLNYLSLPVNLGARFGFQKNMAVSLEVGPTFSYAIFGRDYHDHLDGEKESSNLLKTQEYYTKPISKRFDVGLGASAAVEFCKAYLRVGYDFGFTNVANKQEGEEVRMQQKNRSFFVGLGYRF